MLEKESLGPMHFPFTATVSHVRYVRQNLEVHERVSTRAVSAG